MVCCTLYSYVYTARDWFENVLYSNICGCVLTKIFIEYV